MNPLHAEPERDPAAPVALVPESPATSPARGVAADRRRVAALLGSVLLVSLCGIIYQLQIGAISSYLLGNSVRQCFTRCYTQRRLGDLHRSGAPFERPECCRDCYLGDQSGEFFTGNGDGSRHRGFCN